MEDSTIILLSVVVAGGLLVLVCCYVMRLKLTIKKLERLSEVQQEAINTDHLTGLLSPRATASGLNRLHKLLPRAGEQRVHQTLTYLSLLFIDIDDFGQVNKKFGQNVGDEVLQEVAVAMKCNLRDSDLIGRRGGEEFIVVLPDVSVDKAAEIAEGIRESVSRIRFRLFNVHTTVSIGVACADNQHWPESLVDMADQAMRTAKRRGKNQVCMAGNSLPSDCSDS